MLRFSGHATASMLLAATTALILTACSGGSSHPAAAPADMNTSGAPSSSSGAAGTPAGASQIVISNFAFSPASLSVSPGQTVTVVNKDSVPHTLTAATGKAFDTGNIAAGQSGTFTAPTTSGTYPYICTIHQFMHGTLTVR